LGWEPRFHKRRGIEFLPFAKNAKKGHPSLMEGIRA